jgi:hypothetical protein
MQAARSSCIVLGAVGRFSYLELRIMPRSPSTIPDSTNRDVYLVLDDFRSLGRVWPETDEAGTNRPWMIRSLLEGQYVNPVRTVAFNIAEGWFSRRDHRYCRRTAQTLRRVRRGACLGSQVLGDG